MLRFYIRVTVQKKNEENGTNAVDFPHSIEDAKKFEEEVLRLLDKTHLVWDEDVYMLSVNNIQRIP